MTFHWCNWLAVRLAYWQSNNMWLLSQASCLDCKELVSSGSSLCDLNQYFSPSTLASLLLAVPDFPIQKYNVRDLIKKNEIHEDLGKQSWTERHKCRTITRTLIVRWIFIYSYSARRVSFQVKFELFNLKRNLWSKAWIYKKHIHPNYRSSCGSASVYKGRMWRIHVQPFIQF